MSEEKPCEMDCPKCGHDDINRDFYAKDRYVVQDYNKDYSWLKTQGFTNQKAYENHRATKDFILHHCRCCHYEWATNPLKKVA